MARRLGACTLPARRSRRGVTLIEILIALVLVAIIGGLMFAGVGALSHARLRDSTAMIAGAIRVAYNHANASGKPTRLVFDLDGRMVSLEEGSGRHFVQSGDRAGGAQAATELEAEAVAEAKAIVDGPQAPRARFSPVKSLGFDPEQGKPGKELGSGIFFRQIEVDHEDDPVLEERVYLYFWPGGQTERAAIQLQQGKDNTDDAKILTLLVAPLTGKVTIERGPVEMPRPHDDFEASEREDTG